jgi:hypothetical protein
MLDDIRISEILTSHPAVERVTLRKEEQTSTIQTNSSANLEPLLAQLGLVVVKTKRRRKDQTGNRNKLWPYWYQVRKAPPGSHVLDHDTIVALVCAKVLTLTQNGMPASIMNASDANVDVLSAWSIRYTLRRIGKGLYLMRSLVPSPNLHVYRGEDVTPMKMTVLDAIDPTAAEIAPEIACTQAGPGRETTHHEA